MRAVAGLIAALLLLSAGHPAFAEKRVALVVGNSAYQNVTRLDNPANDYSHGAFGLQIGNSRFSALGDEAFVPSTLTNSKAIYLFEELPLDALKLTFGGRYESTSVSASGDQSIQNFADPLNPVPRFAEQDARKFKGVSAAVGAVYKLGGAWSLSSNLAHTERAPTHRRGPPA